MRHVLVTGGTGVLGTRLVAALAAQGDRVRVMSRRPAPPHLRLGVPGMAEWAQADLITGEGLAAALAGVDTVIHAASDSGRQSQQLDVEGTGRLAGLARQAGVTHLIYISIVGVDRGGAFPYHSAKLAAEQEVAAGGVPWTILRTTQFHELVDRMLAQALRLPVGVLPCDFLLQPIDALEAASALCDAVERGPAGRLPEMGGPQVLRAGELAQAWLRARGKQRLVVPIRLPGAIAAGYRAGAMTAPGRCVGVITWDQWLARRYARR